ncbi:hypothetical protein N1I86_10335 [Bacillus sp. FSL W8-0116]|uniref:hypothetical protein n=1 Tax=Bacillus sp. FSL W8-0116 TaxID=2978206 RepID=UPI0030F4F6D1
MAKKQTEKNQETKGLIEQKKEELERIYEQINENVQQCKAIWEERNACLDVGDYMKATQLEGRYYRLRDVDGKELDNKRIEIHNELDSLQAEANDLKRKLVSDTRILERQKQELEEIKKEYQRRLADKQQSITETEFILEQSEKRLLELEGVE